MVIIIALGVRAQVQKKGVGGFGLGGCYHDFLVPRITRLLDALIDVGALAMHESFVLSLWCSHMPPGCMWANAEVLGVQNQQPMRRAADQQSQASMPSPCGMHVMQYNTYP